MQSSLPCGRHLDGSERRSFCLDSSAATGGIAQTFCLSETSTARIGPRTASRDGSGSCASTWLALSAGRAKTKLSSIRTTHGSTPARPGAVSTHGLTKISNQRPWRPRVDTLYLRLVKQDRDSKTVTALSSIHDPCAHCVVVATD